MKYVEILSPAGDFEKLETVFQFGADAAYLGGPAFHLRAFADNFEEEELIKAVDLAHSLHKKIYVTVNLIAENEDLEKMPPYLKMLDRVGVDALIIADLGVFHLAREVTSLPLHISTQASNTNWRSVKMWQELGASRVILAREVSLENIRLIKEKVPGMEIEVFVHGAMCISYSGRCLLSAVMTGRDANKGACAHPCRWKYFLREEKRPEEYYPILEDDRGTYILNSKDLCTIEFLNQLIEVGVDSLKIEGRIKSMYYAAITTKIYKEARDIYLKTGHWEIQPHWLMNLSSVSNRSFTSGFFLQKPDASSQNEKSSTYVRTHQFIGKVLESTHEEEGFALVEIRNTTYLERDVEIVSPFCHDILPWEFEKAILASYKATPVEKEAHPGMILKVWTKRKLQKGDILRQEN